MEVIGNIMLLAGGLQVEYLLVGGGAGGGATTVSSPQEGGGGGAGGMLTGIAIVAAGTYPVVVGAAGIGQVGAHGTSGGDTTFNSLTAVGGGYGAHPPGDGANGGSGGGTGNGFSNTPGTGTVGQGHDGAQGTISGGAFGFGTAGGGGGAGGAGTVGDSGPGIASSINGSSVTYCVGGAGGGGSGASTTPGSGGSGNGPGGGGGIGGNGQNGTAIIRYIAASPQASGGTITTSGSYQIHTFATGSTNFVVL